MHGVVVMTQEGPGTDHTEGGGDYLIGGCLKVWVAPAKFFCGGPDRRMRGPRDIITRLHPTESIAFWKKRNTQGTKGALTQHDTQH